MKNNKKTAFLTTIFEMNKRYLQDFFKSLKNQTYKNFDIIVVNDGDIDFEKIVKLIDLRLNIIELKIDSSPAKNREYGINYCIDKKYDVLIFGDSDDYFKSNRIEKSLHFLKDSDIVINDLSLFDKNGIYEKKYLSHRLNNLEIVNFEFIKDKNIFGLSNTAIRLENIKKVNFNSKTVAVDWYFFKKLLKQGLKAIFINETETFYRQHEHNTTGLRVKNKKYCLWGEK